MGDKKGSSSYGSGDCGGSAGDYHAMTGDQHGVSDKWVQARVRSGMKRASTKRVAAFRASMNKRIASGDAKASAAYSAKRRSNGMMTAENNQSFHAGQHSQIRATTAIAATKRKK